MSQQLSPARLTRSKALSLGLLLIPYFLYMGFIIRSDTGPIDYETFMVIGQRILAGENPYGPNSYYPLPFGMVFALLSALPRAVSMAIWLIGQLLVFLAIAGWEPWVLLFSPVFAHFVGGQAGVFAVLGLWGYRKNAYGLGGAWLALTLLKPQLALVPVGYALVTWFKSMMRTRVVPKGFLQMVSATALIFLPAFVLMPDWPIHWLKNPRPFFERALSALVPRTLLAVGISPDSPAFWAILIAAALILLILTWYLAKRCLTLELAVTWGFIISPLVHDYDLVQLVPLLDSRRLQFAAVLSSVPGWLVIFSMYGNDSAWYVFSLIAPVVLIVMIWSQRHVPRTLAENHVEAAGPRSLEATGEVAQ